MAVLISLVLAVTAVVGSGAVFCAKRKRFRMFLFGLVTLWIAGSVASRIADHTEPLWLTAMGVSGVLLIPTLTHAALPGLLVRSGERAFAILIATAFASAFAAPTTFYSLLYLGCYLSHDCF